MNKYEEICIDNITYSLDNEKKTAGIIKGSSFLKGDILIPRSIQYNSTEYIVTIILKRAFQYSYSMKSIRFSSDSELHTIEKDAFLHSSIESIEIPSSLKELKKGWCFCTSQLTKIQIDPNNKFFSYLNDQYIIGKSDEQTQNYDCLLFARRDIKTAIIPTFIKRIRSYAFSNCEQLQELIISSESELQTIEKSAFNFSKIRSITFQKNLDELNEGWCKNTTDLSNINLMPNNPRYSFYEDKFIIGKSSPEIDNYDSLIFCPRDAETAKIPDFIKIIGPYAFQYCKKLTEIEIPPQITVIDNHAFYFCFNLRTIKIPLNSELKTIGKEAFRYSGIESIYLPPHITKIEEQTFAECKLKTIEIPTNSQLQSIEKMAFSESDIQIISIPPSLKKICEMAFYSCQSFSTIEIPPNSELTTIEKEAFAMSIIREITIPPSLVDLQKDWNSCIILNKITVLPNNPRYLNYEDKFVIGKSSLDSPNYDVLVSCASELETILIPSNIEIIESYAFDVSQIRHIEFNADSKLRIICKHAFSDSHIESIIIPSHVTNIGEFAFYRCGNLRRVEFASNSEIQDLEKGVFCSSSIEYFSIPVHLTQIKSFTFEYCQKLRRIEIPENSELQSFNEDAFSHTFFECIFIPPHLTYIGVSAFSYSNIKRIEFPLNSELQIIEKNAFQCSKIRCISLPGSLKKIGDGAFSYCRCLQIIEISENSLLEKINQKKITTVTSEVMIMIPSKLKSLVGID